jgi:hypothetical protein
VTCHLMQTDFSKKSFYTLLETIPQSESLFA